ncbi:hypothetical protein MGYG_01080 [Nannizzia gypsea CBS 118893]|uniref:Fe2OG dioxygenase domain-containing protein n=1 Tax=Arthroderma gypseum (strain ATCC MYA-4604 / CBS 118893) TaxID=535722 RepID=E5QYG6_ARTGP|nr:hypothetical protein MGYG_01080 [Nannizzia gypsea CBS 118893]EFQ98042.1 hypothetical protein MGYG_01080 [Nannizzia gypsea CBS 118893]
MQQSLDAYYNDIRDVRVYFRMRNMMEGPLNNPEGLESYRISQLPDAAYYVPNFISEGEEEILLNKIASVPAPKWTQLSRRRLQTWPSALSKSNTLLASPLPEWLELPITSRFRDLCIFTDSPHQSPNHVLINEYQPGQGIMPHEDGAAYYPIVATVSLAAPIILDIYDKRQSDLSAPEPPLVETQEAVRGQRVPRFRILQERRSLLVTTGNLYSDFLHGIAERVSDEDLGEDTICNWGNLGDSQPFCAGKYERQTRISLTYRDVLKVSKLGNSIKYLSKR